MGYPNWVLIVIAVFSLMLATFAHRNANFWQCCTALSSLLGWTSTSLTRSSNRVTPGLTTHLCKIPAVPWAFDCGSPNITGPDIVVNMANHDRISDAVRILSESFDDLLQAFHVVKKFRRDLRSLASNLPFDATHQMINDVNRLLVSTKAYEIDLYANFDFFNLRITVLLHLFSGEISRVDDPTLYKEPWRGVSTMWGEFHTEIVDRLTICISDFATMHQTSKVLLLACQAMSDSLESLRAETEQSALSQARKGIRLWNSPASTNHYSEKTSKMFEDMRILLEKALDLFKRNRNAAEAALAALQAAERNIDAGKPNWTRFIGKRARHIPATLVDLEEARRLSLDFITYENRLRNLADPGHEKPMSETFATHGFRR